MDAWHCDSVPGEDREIRRNKNKKELAAAPATGFVRSLTSLIILVLLSDRILRVRIHAYNFALTF